jgi:2-polyprenyl-3-methyl-5-hydroxy-6-metoxy-1,4-benzoquinol methylase
MTTAEAVQAPQDDVMDFAFKVVGELGAALAGAHVYIGDRLLLFKTLAHDGPFTVEQLAEVTGLHERYLREWASAMAASGFIDYSPDSRAFSLPATKAAVLAHEDSPVFLGGFAQMLPDHYAVIPGIIDAFRNGGGVPYTQFSQDTFEGTERFFRPGYVNFLVQEWLPATGYVPRLQSGAKFADVGCGRGQAVCVLAAAYPRSTFVGYDNHAPGIEAARVNAERAGVAARTSFQVRAATDLPQTADFDLISTLDALHDMVDPHGAARSIRGALKPDGAWFIVEPNVSDRLEDNLNPVGRVFYAVSMLQCMSVSLAHDGAGYGAAMGPANLRHIVEGAGFRSLERLPIDNPFNAFYLAHP